MSSLHHHPAALPAAQEHPWMFKRLENSSQSVPIYPYCLRLSQWQFSPFSSFYLKAQRPLHTGPLLDSNTPLKFILWLWPPVWLHMGTGQNRQLIKIKRSLECMPSCPSKQNRRQQRALRVSKCAVRPGGKAMGSQPAAKQAESAVLGPSSLSCMLQGYWKPLLWDMTHS